MHSFNVYENSSIESFINLLKDKTIVDGKQILTNIKNFELNFGRSQTFEISDQEYKIISESVSRREVSLVYADIIMRNDSLLKLFVSNKFVLLNSISIHYLSRASKLYALYCDPTSRISKNLDYSTKKSESRLRWVYDNIFNHQNYYRNVFYMPVSLYLKMNELNFRENKKYEEAEMFVTNARDGNISIEKVIYDFYFSGNVLTNTQHFENLASRYIIALNPYIILYIALHYTNKDGSLMLNICSEKSDTSLPKMCKYLDQISTNYFIENMSVLEIKKLIPATFN